ncbi:MAG: hydrogenase iron-sulfur subunit, partial [Gaiellales bacterium]
HRTGARGGRRMSVTAVSRPAAAGDATEPSATAEATAVPAGAVFEPLLIGFTCNWCSYRAADLAGTARIKYPPNVRLVRLMCAGRLDPTFVLKAFAGGADGVMVTGCWPGDCHYREQNFKGLRRFLLLRRVITALGIEPARLQLVWASAAEGDRLAHEIGRVVEEVRALGPLDADVRLAEPVVPLAAVEAGT